MATGMLAFSGISAALYARANGKAEGQHVQVSLLETGIALLGYHVTGYTMAGKLPTREGSGVWHLVPYQAFRTADGWILAGATNDAVWRRLCAAIGAEELAEDAVLSTAAGRIANRDEVTRRLGEIFATRLTEEWVPALDAANVPCAPVNDIPSLLAHPQVAATEMLAEAHDPAGGAAVRMCGIPIKMSETPGVVGASSPRLGEHTDAVLGEELGYSQEEIRTMREQGAI